MSLTTVVKTALGRKGLGYRVDPVDSRDVPLAVRLKDGTAPPYCDLSRSVESVLDQGASSSCVAHAFAQALRTSRRLAGLQAMTLPSRLALYYWARAEHGDAKVDAGTYLRSCAKALTRFGVPAEHWWPFELRKVNKPPTFQVYRAGHDSRLLTGYYRCFGLNDVRLALAAERPVVFGMQLGSSFIDNSGPAVIDYDTGSDIGGHAMTCVGYEPGRFRIVNSWGTSWRDGGLAWLTDRRMSEASDIWAVDTTP